MRQVRVHGAGDLRLDDVDPPDPGPDDAVVRIAACGICGSDLSYIRMGGVGRPSRRPLCLGHEMSGVVTFVGDSVSSVSVGDRVVVQPGNAELGRIGGGGPEGGLTSELLVRAADTGLIHPVPDHVPLDVAALAEPVAVGMHAAEQAEVRDGEGVAVFGCGPVGLAAIASLVDRGHERVVGIDLSSTRRDLAIELGAQAAIDPTEHDVWGALADLHGTTPFTLGPTPSTGAFIEASGSPQVLADIITRGPAGGRMSVVALHFDPVPTNYLLVMMKQFTIRGAMEYPDRFADAVDLLGRRDLSSMVTDRFDLEQVHCAVELLANSKECGKVLITVAPDAQ